jgi:hypothetical protein
MGREITVITALQANVNIGSPKSSVPTNRGFKISYTFPTITIDKAKIKIVMSKIIGIAKKRSNAFLNNQLSYIKCIPFIPQRN